MVDDGGWRGFWTDPRRSGRLPLERLADSAAPVLAVIDYAETRTEQLTDLLRRLDAADGAQVRLLLLARAAGDWWDRAARDLGGGGPVGGRGGVVDPGRHGRASGTTPSAPRSAGSPPSWPA